MDNNVHNVHHVHQIVDDWRITTDGNTLRVVGASKLDPSTRKYIKGHKAEIISFLQTKPVEPTQHNSRSIEQGHLMPSIINGELRIPVHSDPKYRWWQGGQSIFNTLLELNASDDLIEQYIGPIESPADWRRWKAINAADRIW